MILFTKKELPSYSSYYIYDLLEGKTNIIIDQCKKCGQDLIDRRLWQNTIESVSK